MGFCKTSAITLRRRDYSNTSQIATFYTRDYGKLRALAKGSKRTGKRALGSIDLLCYSEIIFIKRETTGLHILTDWDLLEGFPVFRKDIERFYSGCYVAELVEELTEEGERNEPLFSLILHTFYGLSQTRDIAVELLAFEFQALKLLGYLPEMERCANCQVKLLQGQEAFFSPNQKGLSCCSCAGEGDRRLSPGALQAANFLANASPQGLGRLHLSPSTCGELRGLSAVCLSSALERPISMWKYIR